MRRVLRVLRSRRLAIWLILGVGAWSALATAVPQATLDPAAAESFARTRPALAAIAGAVGLDRAYSAMPFLLVIAVLGLSTLLCAWERTSWAFRRYRSPGRKGTLAGSDVERLRERPAVSLPVSGDTARATTTAATALRGLHLRVVSGPRLVSAESGRWGLFGSPLFHWSLALLFVVIALGSLTRSEGFIGVPVGSSRIDSAESYGRLEVGPLFAGHSGLEIAVSDLVLDYMDGDQSRGAAPIVTLLDDGREVASQRVFPNNPLRYRSLLIHMDNYGLAVAISVETTAAERQLSTDVLVDLDEASATGTAPSGFYLSDPAGGAEADVRVEVVLPDAATAPDALATVSLSVDGGGWLEDISATGLTRDGTLALSNGTVLRVDDLGYYARLSVADDWSVPWIYALFVALVIGLSVALVVPHRVVRVLLVDDGEEVRVHATVSHSRRDPTWRERVEVALREALDAPDEPVRPPENGGES